MLRKNQSFEVDTGRDAKKKRRMKERSTEVLGLLARDDKEEAELESKVFGGQVQLLESLDNERLTPSFRNKERGEDKSGVLDREKAKPVWEDADDAESEQEKSHSSEKRKRSRHKERQTQFERALGSRPSWARLKSERSDESQDSDRDSDSEDESYIPLSRRTGTYLTSSATLPQRALDYQACTDANVVKRTKKCVTQVEFHRGAQVVLVAGFDQTLNLFQVDGEHNPKIQSIFLERFPIHAAHFSADGNEVIMSSDYRWFHSFDMMTGKVNKIPYIKGVPERSLPQFCVSPDGKLLAFRGKHGQIYLVSAKSKEYVATLTMNGRVMDLTFSADGSRLFGFGDDCDVYIWDVNDRRCIHKFADDGCTMGTAISVSDNGQYLATGSESGIVNIYDQDCFLKMNPKPLRVVKNLTTRVSVARFCPSNEILGIASYEESNAIKMIHLPSCEAFNNFGDSRHQYMRCVRTMDFSPNSGYFCVGNSNGRALLFRLKHYDSY